MEEHPIYIFHNKVQLAKILSIIDDFEVNGWIFVSNYDLLESNDVYHLYPVTRVRMIKNGKTKWIFIDPNGKVKILNEN